MALERLAELAEMADGESRERLVEALNSLLEIHHDALARILEIVEAHNDLSLLGKLREDPLIAGVLDGHALVSLDLRPRVAGALDALEPWLSERVARAKVTGVEEGVARIELTTSLESGDPVALADALAARISESVPELSSVNVSRSMNLGYAAKPRRWVPLVHRHELAGGRLKGVRAFEMDLLVCEIGGKAFAFKDACPSGGEPLADALLEGLVITCRAHGARFELNTGRGATKGGPALAMLPVKLDDVAMHVALDAFDTIETIDTINAVAPPGGAA